ncbi:BAR-domain-containing protein [Phlegmacium glaucopus]|nr:BAR-domain-containing protein [Phlegmacium glaucopus]
MASKQEDYVRLWAGEVISSREKTTVHDEFRDLEKDIESRKDGIHRSVIWVANFEASSALPLETRLLVASEAYQHALSKKKASDLSAGTDKLLPIDALGLVMINHGEEFGGDSSFGRALVKLGRAHCKVATLQEAYALTLKDTFLTSMDQFKEDIKECENLRKKFDSRRLTYDAAVIKYEKVLNNKKEREKDKREAEDELDRAKQRYDEMAEDLRAHMHAIQENEHNQLQEMTSFLALETNFVQSYLDVLHEVKEDWQGGIGIKRNGRSKGNSQRLHTPQQLSRTNSVRSNGRGATPSSLSSDLSDAEQSTISKRFRKGSGGSKPPSRPASGLSRMRAKSSASSPPSGEDVKDGNERSRRRSVAGWASSAVDSVTGSKGKKGKDKDKEAFATLDNGDAAKYQTNGTTGGTPKKAALRPRSSSKSKSRESLPSTAPKVTPRILKPPSMQGKKVVRALYDFSGSTEELSFKAGNEIVVLNEVLDDWWMGELDGQKGLFPLSYTEAVSSNLYLPRPQPQSRGDDTHQKPGVSGCVNEYGKQEDYLTSDVDEDGELAAAPMVVGSSFYGPFNDTMSFTSSMADDEDTQPMFISQDEQPFQDADHPFVMPPTPPPQRRRRSILQSGDSAQQPLINGTLDSDPSSYVTTTATPTKKPPPPRPRRPVNHSSSSGPPIPERKLPVVILKTSSSGSSLNVTPSTSLGSQNHGYDRSPFESAIELEGGTIGCGQFRQNPFKPKGMCSNCLEFHD